MPAGDVASAMSTEVLSVGPGHTLRQVAVVMASAKVGSAVVHDTDGAGPLAELMLKYKLHTAPVVDAEGKMAGTIVIEDVLEYVMHKR